MKCFYHNDADGQMAAVWVYLSAGMHHSSEDIRDINEVDDLVVSEMTTTKEVENSVLITEGLTIKQEEDIIKWIFSKLANKDTTFEEVKYE